MWYFVADIHAGHSNIIKYCKRPFMTREEEGIMGMIDRGSIPQKELRISNESTTRMTDTIFQSINDVVGESDTLVIVGDFCFTPRERRQEIAKSYRDRINCKNVFLILGNHDDRKLLAHLFTGCYDQYTFKVDGQSIFCSHYPCRSWDGAHHGSWMLYGHVHNLLWKEDNGQLMAYQEKVYSDKFKEVLDNFAQGMGATNQNVAYRDQTVKELLDAVASVNGVDLTLDVGVDNVREGVPFGTPWSMDDLRTYMGKKKRLWEKRSDVLRNLRPASTLKDSNADPKF